MRALEQGTSAYTSRGFRAQLSELGIPHRRGGYRDPESQAFIESWFSKLKEREVWRHDYETLADARAGVERYVNRYHHRPHRADDLLDLGDHQLVHDAAPDADAEREQALPGGAVEIAERELHRLR